MRQTGNETSFFKLYPVKNLKRFVSFSQFREQGKAYSQEQERNHPGNPHCTEIDEDRMSADVSRKCHSAQEDEVDESTGDIETKV